jgi:putative membrane protein
MEVAPVLDRAALLLATKRRFPLTQLALVLIAIHAAILCVGGRYTYARVPLGAWVSEQFGWQRNHYDRLGHFAQGFVPAIVAREILLRCSPLRRGAWLFFLVTCVALAISALYEMVEWARH